MEGLKKASSSPKRKRCLINNNSKRVDQLARIAAEYQLSLVQRKIASLHYLHDEKCVDATKSATPKYKAQLEQLSYQRVGLLDNRVQYPDPNIHRMRSTTPPLQTCIWVYQKADMTSISAQSHFFHISKQTKIK